MSDDDFDDGLVHCHGWAQEPKKSAASARPAAPIVADEDCFDDGLVHEHRWASDAV